MMTEMRTSLFAGPKGLVKSTFPSRYFHRRDRVESDPGKITLKTRTNRL